MYENGGEIVIGGKPYPAIFNVAALEEITTRYGGLDGLAEEFKKDPAKAIGEIAWVIELLTTQGAALKNLQEGTEIKVPSSRDIKVLMKPKELMKQQDLIIEIINAGMGDEDERADEEIEIDEVLEEIEASKKEPGAGA